MYMNVMKTLYAKSERMHQIKKLNKYINYYSILYS